MSPKLSKPAKTTALVAALLVIIAIFAYACSGPSTPSSTDDSAEGTPTPGVSTSAPATQRSTAPTSDAPTSEAPTTDAPTSEAPVSQDEITIADFIKFSSGSTQYTIEIGTTTTGGTFLTAKSTNDKVNKIVLQVQPCVGKSTTPLELEWNQAVERPTDSHVTAIQIVSPDGSVVASFDPADYAAAWSTASLTC